MPRRPFLIATLLFAAAGLTGAQTDPNRLKLTVDKGAGGDLQFTWVDSCGEAGTDYAIHEGTLGSFASHTAIQCGTGTAASYTVSPTSGNTYYLVVTMEGAEEGSYGVDSDGVERPVGLSTCQPQQAIALCVEDNVVDAEPARVTRLDQVHAAAQSILDAGGTYTDVANMLAAEGDVTGIFSNTVSLHFVVGGLSTMIYDTAAARLGGPLHEIIPPAAAPPPTSHAATTGPINADAAQAVLPVGQRMVGEDDDGDGFRDLPKHALVLSPWEYEFAPNDSAPMVRDFLNTIRDYQEGSVVYKNNASHVLTHSMKVSDWTTGWDDKDIIFISTHGEADPDSVWGPAPYLFLGVRGIDCTDLAIDVLGDTPDPANRPGIHCIRTWTEVDGNNYWFSEMIGTDTFFQSAHGGQLNKKLIYADGCETAKHPGLAQALTGTDSIFLGWSDYVLTGVSVNSANKVLRETVEDGFPVLRSFVRECAGGGCIEPADDTDRAELLAGWDRADLRTREALHIPATPLHGFCGESPTLPVSETCPSCGGIFGMAFVYDITLDGLEPADLALYQDPLDFGKYQLRLFADIDGMESGYADPLADYNMIDAGNGSYMHFPQVTLFGDNICPNDVIEYNPWVLLPTFDETMPGNDARDRIYSWDGPFTIEIVPEQVP